MDFVNSDCTGEITDPMEKLSSFAMKEIPKIQTAIKNEIAVILGRSTADEELKLMLTPERVLVCARILSKALNSYELCDYMEWAERYPQLEDQTALSRLDQLTQYKVIKFLHDKVKLTSGKVSQLFGRSFLLWSQLWPSLQEEIIRQNNRDRVASPLVLNYFLECFGETLQESSVDATLVWAVDFNHALSLRHEERRRLAASRILEPVELIDPMSTEVEGSDSLPLVNRPSTANSEGSNALEQSGADVQGGAGGADVPKG